MKCYLITTRHKGMFGKNWLLFWGPDNRGYSCDIRTAGIYESDKEKYPIILSRKEYREKVLWVKIKPDDFLIPVEVIEKEFNQFNLIEI